MDISRLHREVINFAKGMPAFAISWSQVMRDVARIEKALGGIEPDQPAISMKNIPMPLYRLAFSGFVHKLTLTPSASSADLGVELIANVHPLGRPELVIREYKIVTISPTPMVLDYLSASGEVYWRLQGLQQPDITPNWGPDYIKNLGMTSIPAPQDQNYLDEVERTIFWLTGSSFINLVAQCLPKYPLTEFVPWLRFLNPIQSYFDRDHIIITASSAEMTTPGCNPTSVIVVPDPTFPYGEPIPAPFAQPTDADFAVYSPKTRLVDFVAGSLQPAILVRNENLGGFVKSDIAGAFGLSKFTVDIGVGSGPTGIVDISAQITFLGEARAWIDGPSGMRIGLASASVIGDGDLGATISLSSDIPQGTVTADLRITQSDLPNVRWDIHSPLPWPLDAIGAAILDGISKDEIKKLNRQVVRLGKWNVLGLPLSYVDTLRGNGVIPNVEGAQRVSALFSIKRKPGDVGDDEDEGE